MSASLTQAEIVAAVDAAQEHAIALLSELVAFDSLLGNEQPCQDRLRAYMEQELGVPVTRVPLVDSELRTLQGYSLSPDPDTPKESLYALFRPTVGAGVSAGQPLIFNGHIDVVPVVGSADRWTTPPFTPSIRDGRLYGRGAGDMKAGVVAFLVAFRALRQLGFEPAAPVCLQTVVEEECSGNGALAVTHALRNEMAEGGCLAGAAVIIPEPFAAAITTSQVGVMWLEIVVLGKPVHVLDTSAGANAIEQAMTLWASMKELEAAWNEPERRHPLYKHHPHPLNFSLGRIEGGDWTSSVPSKCTLYVRIGHYPGSDLAQVRKEVEDFLKAAATTKGVRAHEVIWRGFQAEGCEVSMETPAMKKLAEVHESVIGAPAAQSALTCTTDARYFQLYHHLASTCYGPEATLIHGIDESVSLKSLRDVTAVLAVYISQWCGLQRIAK